MAVGEVWGENVALACVRFWMRAQFPNDLFTVRLHKNPYTFCYHTQIRVTAKDGTAMVVEFETFDTDFNANSYSIPEETQASLMLLLG